MAQEVLSQEEIDKLLASINSGEHTTEELKKDKSKIQKYDFKHAMRFSRDQIRTLTRVHEGFARSLQTYLSAQLRVTVTVTVNDKPDQFPYEEYIRSLNRTTILNIFTAEPLSGRMVLEVNPSIAFPIVDRLCGGSGQVYEGASAPTELEAIVMQRIFTKTLQILGESWASVIPATPEYAFAEYNPQFIQLVSPNETVLAFSFKVIIGKAEGFITLCLPHIVLEPFLPNLSNKHWLSSQKRMQSEEETLELQKKVAKTTIPISVELGKTTLSIRDFLEMSVGNVIELDQLKNDPLKVKTGNQLKFLARPGVSNNRVAVQIEKTIEEGDL